NILMQPDGWPVLLDFGAARQVIADRTQSITSILKPSFAPIEQYAHAGELRQGAWTDLYSLGAVMYFMIVGHAPPPAAARALDDERQRRGGANGPHHAPATRRIALAALAIPLCVGAGAWGVYTQTADTRPHIVATAAAATLAKAAPATTSATTTATTKPREHA